MLSIGLSRSLRALAQAVTIDSAPASQAAQSHALPPRWLIALSSVGLCALVVSIVRRAANPHKLSLRNTPGRNNSLTPLHILGVLAVWAGLTWLTNQLIGGRGDPSSVIVTAIGQAVLLGGALVAARLTFRHGLRRGLGLSMRHWLFDTGRGILGYLAVLPICLLLLLAIPRTPDDTHTVLRMLPGLSVWWKVVTVLFVVVLTPITEEVFFRGLLQSMFRRYIHSPWVGIAASSAIFVLLHHPQWKDMLPLFALAVAMGYNYERCGRLYPAILIHAIFNAVNIAVVLIG